VERRIRSRIRRGLSRSARNSRSGAQLRQARVRGDVPSIVSGGVLLMDMLPEAGRRSKGNAKRPKRQSRAAQFDKSKGEKRRQLSAHATPILSHPENTGSNIAVTRSHHKRFTELKCHRNAQVMVADQTSPRFTSTSRGKYAYQRPRKMAPESRLRVRVCFIGLSCSTLNITAMMNMTRTTLNNGRWRNSICEDS
jgi:hypothetical protein